jgi:ribosomal protein S18 acetylase RimI-like enzyme
MISDTLTFREAFSDDKQKLALFFEENNTPEITTFFHPFALCRETAESLISTPRLDRFYLLLSHDQIVGFSMLRGWDEGFVIPSLGMFIHFRRQGRGWGKILLEHTVEDARRLDCSEVKLTVYAGNVIAHNLYKSYGFVEVVREAIMLAQNHDERIVMHMNLSGLPINTYGTARYEY